MINPSSGVAGEFSLPYLDGPFPAIVVVHDDALVEDQVKEEARLLARHGFAVLGCIITGDESLRSIANAGRELSRQKGVLFPEASLVVLSGSPQPPLEAVRRLSGYRMLLLVDPPAPPPLLAFEGVTDPVVAVFRSESNPNASLWRDAIAFLPSRGSKVVIAEELDTAVVGVLTPEQRTLLVNLLRESYE
jgi:hypothetical protein